jgi:hypothetical protein
MMIRPGPPAIEPNLAPDGLVIYCYAIDRTGDEHTGDTFELVRVSYLQPDADLEQIATADADAVGAQTREVCLVIYDGDTGERMPPPQRWAPR